MQWMLLPFRRYVDFDGRSRRKEYWMFFLMNVLFWSAWYLVAVWGGSISLWTHRETEWLLTPFLGIAGIYALAGLVPGLAVAVRRLHDTDRSAWNVFWGLVPLIGGFILLYFLVSDGTPGPNRFGDDPKDRATPTYP